MKRRIEVEVEPLSDARWEKIDAAVFAALDTAKPEPAPRSRRLAWIGGLAALVAAAAVIALVVRGPRDAFVNEASHIETGAAASRVAYGFASIEVAPDSAVTTSGDDAHGMVVVLDRGSVDCEVAPRAGRPPFVVQAGDVRVRVIGTRFVVRRAADRTTAVEVKHGTVEVARGGESTFVHAGETWPPSSPEPVPSTTPSIAPSLDPAPPPTTSHPNNRAPHPAKSAEVHGDQRLYDQALRGESRDPDGSMSTYRKLAQGNGPWAPNALYAAGRLAHERGQRAEAKRLLEQYLARWPNGGNAEDARRLLGTLR